MAYNTIPRMIHICCMIALYILAATRSYAFYSSGKIDNDLAYQEMRFIKVTGQLYNQCYLEGEIINKSSKTIKGIKVKIQAFDFFNKELWEKTININELPPITPNQKGHPFKKETYQCIEPFTIKFEVARNNIEESNNIANGKSTSDIQNANMLKISAYIKDTTLNVVLLYLNKETDNLIHWKNQRIKGRCIVYANNGSLLNHIRGEEIASINRTLEKSDQSIYIDMPSIPPTHSGIVECKVNTGYKELIASDDFLFHNYKEPLKTKDKLKYMPNNDPAKNDIPAIPVKYKITLQNGKQLYGIMYETHNDMVYITTNEGRYGIPTNSVQKIEEIKSTN